MADHTPTDRDLAILQAIIPYVPRRVVLGKIANPAEDPVQGTLEQGTLLLADVSGFTPMSERLAELGRQGAEELTRILNEFFTVMLDIVCDYGGDVLKFGGDAFLVLFASDTWGNGTLAARRALRCALEMQEAMVQFDHVETLVGHFRLRMSIALSAGQFLLASVGQPQRRLEYIVTSETVNALMRTEEATRSGQVCVTDATLRYLGDGVVVGKTGNGVYPVTGLATEVKRQPCLPPVIEQGDLARARPTRVIRALAPYLPAGLLEKIEADPAQRGVEGEHRRVTTVFVNFRDMSQVIHTLGPDHIKEAVSLISDYLTCMETIVARYGGMMARSDPYSQGDKLLIMFGAPTAHENDEERAILCALEMMDTLCRFNDEAVVPLRQRIGINTGHAFTGDVGSAERKEYTVMGDAVNLAARLMGLACDGQIIVGRSTWLKVADRFTWRALGPTRVKGKTELVQVYEVLDRRVPAAASMRPRRENGTIVGREEEIACMHAAVTRALTGHGQLLSISGEAGIGKTRLAEELMTYCQSKGMTQLRADCVSYGTSTPYLPWVTVLRTLFGINPEDSHRARLTRITSGLTSVRAELAAWTPLVGRILGLDVRDNELTASLDPEMRKRRFFDIVTDLVRQQAEERPLLLVFEDVHWMDGLSLELLNHLAHNVQDVPALIVAIHRPDITLDAWRECDTYHEIVLTELTGEQTLTLVNSLVHLPDLPEALERLVLARSQGNPFYAQEVVRALLDFGHLAPDEAAGGYRLVGDLNQVEMPDTIEGLIMSRVDRLSERSRNVLRVASVIGRSFSYKVLRSIYPFTIDASQLRSELETLNQLGFTLPTKPGPDAQYTFKHVMTQQVVYDSLLFARRRELHFKTGQFIEATHQHQLHEYYEVLAFHFLRAERWRNAMKYHRLAGEKALGLYANQTAVDYFSAALRITDHIDADTTAEEVTIHELLGDTYTILGKHPEALDSYRRARRLLRAGAVSTADRPEKLARLCRKTGASYERKGGYATAFQWLEQGLRYLQGKESAEKAQIYMMGGLIHYRQGRYAEARDWGRQAVELARRCQAKRELARAYNLIGISFLRLGDISPSIEFFAKGLAIYETVGDATGVATTHLNLGNVYLELGHWNDAIDHYQKSLRIRERIGDIDRIAMVSNNLGQLYLNQGALSRAIEAFKRSQGIWERTGYTFGLALAHNNLGAAYTRLGELDQALSHVKKGLELLQAIQAERFLPEAFRNLAEVYLRLNQTEEALDNGQQSLDLAVRLRMRQEEGPTLRVLGQIYHTLGQWEKAETHLRNSLRIAEQVGARYERGKVLFHLALLYADRAKKKGRAQEKGAGLRELQGAMAIFDQLGANLDLAKAHEAQTLVESALDRTARRAAAMS